jgi:tetratricopeptide (TPR) repeat protein
MKEALAAQVNKTDRNDARGIARMMRVGLYRPVHVKTRISQKKRMLLTSRKLLQGQIRALENDLRGSLRTFGLKVGATSAGAFDERVRELVVEHPALAAIVGPLLAPRGADTLPSRGRWTRRAIECLRKALRAAPDYADAMFNLALLLQRKNQYPEAADYWRRYLASDSRSDWATRARRSLKFCEMQSHLSASA